ncbi:DUF3606 domain-containing protein [Mesorhizobium sp.]|uniref:DUF3606 domain-containing protein n=1 Tax=Mesorhizobium sp. TaxID=1871066 RepID=UPI0012271E92|nr:DUF3606 domain-containing protein [Mesorhizobium sp.]TIS94143.1 MAG: DUF3606 domain-containing protein [Mesorhizobium sp.]
MSIRNDLSCRRLPRSYRQLRGDRDYEVNYFALKNTITPDQVRDLIRKHGNDRATLTEAAKALPGT